MDIACSSRYRHNTAAEVLCTVKVILCFRYYFTHHQFCKYMYMSTVSIEQSVIEKYNQVFGSSNRNLSTTLFQEKQGEIDQTKSGSIPVHVDVLLPEGEPPISRHYHHQ